LEIVIAAQTLGKQGADQSGAADEQDPPRHGRPLVSCRADVRRE
jgi:hypothetical protein